MGTFWAKPFSVVYLDTEKSPLSLRQPARTPAHVQATQAQLANARGPLAPSQGANYTHTTNSEFAYLTHLGKLQWPKTDQPGYLLKHVAISQISRC